MDDYNGIDPTQQGMSAEMPPPMMGRKPKTDFDSFFDLVKATTKKIKQRDRSGYARRHKKWHEGWNFFNGQQYGFFDEESGGYYDLDPDEQNKFYICNFLSWQFDTTQKEWARSNTILQARAVGDKQQAQGAGRVGTDVLAHYQRKYRTPIAQQEEGETAGITGVYARYTNINPKKSGGKGKLPIMQTNQAKMGEDTYSCPQCAAMMDDYMSRYDTADPQVQAMMDSHMDSMAMSSGSMSDLMGAMPDGAMMGPEPMCPSCGSPVEVMEAPTVEYDEQTGEEEVDLPDIDSWPVDPFELIVDPRARCGQAETTSYIFRHRIVNIWDAEETYWWFEIPKGAERGREYHNGLRYKEALQRAVGANTQDWGTGEYYTHSEPDDSDSVVLEEVWMDAPMYAAYVFDDEAKFGNPEDPFIIQPGIPLGEQYPNGIMIAMIGGKICDAREENKNDHWVFGVYRVFSPSFWGRSAIEDSVWQQKLLNDVYNMMVDYLRYCTSPTVVVNSNFIDVNMLSGNFGEVVTVDNAGNDANLAAYYLQVAPPPMPASIPNFIELCKKDIQAQLGAFSPLAGSGDPNSDITTATGVKLYREAAIALIAMALAIKAHVDAKWGKQILKLAQKYFDIPRAIMVQRREGSMETKWFSSVDIDAELEVTYARHSVIPRSESEDQNDFVAALSVGQLPLGLFNPMLQEVAPEAAQLGRERFNIPFDSDRYEKTERVARDRLDKILEVIPSLPMLAAETGMQLESPDPSIPSLAIQWVLSQPGISIEPDFDDHPAHMRFYTDFMHEDEGMFADDLTKEVIRARYNEHYMANIMKLQKQGAGQVAAQLPEMAAQAQMGAQSNASGAKQSTPNPPGKKQKGPSQAMSAGA